MNGKDAIQQQMNPGFDSKWQIHVDCFIAGTYEFLYYIYVDDFACFHNPRPKSLKQ